MGAGSNIINIMIYPDNFEAKIGFTTVRHSIMDLCNSPVGKYYADKMKFMNRYDEVMEHLNQTEEMRSILSAGIDFPSPTPDDLSLILSELKSYSSYLSATKLLIISKVLLQAASIEAFFKKNNHLENGEIIYPALAKVGEGIITMPAIVALIDGKINKFGEIKDNASEVLYSIRSALRGAQGAMSRAMRKVMDKAIAEGIIDKDTSPSIRDGRMVMPVEAAKKRAINGLIHDSSATGKTVFIEPFEVVEISNRIKELRLDENQEEIRILKSIAAEIRPYIGEISKTSKILGKYDFITAKAKFALSVDGMLPNIDKERVLEWYHAVHPTLLISLREQGREVVPLSLDLSEKHRILIISGPNAGGKSVCLKTIGIIQYMTQCGILPTVYENSHVGIFENLYVDIGDEQSLENDLSTYSSHLRNMKFFMQHISRKSLFLVDEMGSGTEPQIGGALAQAILVKLEKSGCMGVVTTHYQNLKTFAGEHDGFINGAMLYDREHLQPTFQLSVGSPGSSFAIEIARKIGLGNDVIKNAQEIVGDNYINMDKYMLDIARDRRYWSNKRQNIREKEAKLDRLLAQYENKSDDLRAQRQTIIHDARKEAKKILSEVNAKIEKTIRDIRAVAAEKEATKAIRKDLEEYKKMVTEGDGDEIDEITEPFPGLKNKRKIKKIYKKVTDKPKNESESQLLVGDYVKMKDTSVAGKIIKIAGQKAEVAFGVLRSNIDISKLIKVVHIPQNETVYNYTLTSQTLDSSRKRQLEFKQDIDVRGMRGDEAVQAVMYFLDDAVQFGASRLRILHGTGHGILKTLIRQQLDAYPAVKSYADEDVRFGGAGITVVNMEE